MADLQVKYQPKVVEYFDIRLDTEAAFHLRATLAVAIAELDAHPTINALLEALEAAIDQSADGAGSTDAVDDEAVGA